MALTTTFANVVSEPRLHSPAADLSHLRHHFGARECDLALGRTTMSMLLANYPAGRVLLHAIAAAADHEWRFHLDGIRRELHY